MKRFLVFVLFSLSLVVTGAAAAGPNIGFADDATKYAADGGASLFGEMNAIGATSNRVAVFWNASQPSTIQDESFLDRMIPQAASHHIQVVFAIYPQKPTMAPVTPDAVNAFCSYAVQVMRRYPYVTKVIIGNEPNQPAFWQPVFNSDGSPASPAAMEAVLASCYDQLKAYNPSIDVIGVGLSPRGNDDPQASSDASISPVRWIADLGAAYRASGRTKPLFDEFSWHCYPDLNTDSVELGYAWPNIGCVNAARLKLALYDAFNGTVQPVPPGYTGARGTLFPSLMTIVDETGWQVDTTGLPGYTDVEDVPTVTEDQQAYDYAELVLLADCDPSLTDFHIFHIIDEASRLGFQSGVLQVDGTPRLSASTIQKAITSDHGTCSGGLWQTLGSEVLSSTSVVPLFGTYPYSNPLPYATRATAGGGQYVHLQAGEGFSYSVFFLGGATISLETVSGDATRGSASVKVPSDFQNVDAKAFVVLTADANHARAYTNLLDLG
jgi:hypothetical protein